MVIAARLSDGGYWIFVRYVVPPLLLVILVAGLIE